MRVFSESGRDLCRVSEAFAGPLTGPCIGSICHGLWRRRGLDHAGRPEPPRDLDRVGRGRADRGRADPDAAHAPTLVRRNARSSWGKTPRESIEQECARRGSGAVEVGCIELLKGRDVDAELVLALGGSPARWAVIEEPPG